jgi:dTDP-4-amino-4,6-dideoxygalactose transaminase
MRTEPATPPVTTVPFLDLAPSHSALKSALLDELATLIEGAAFTNGPQVRAFEEAFAAYCGTAECVGLASGLDALRLAFIAAGIEPGDEVVLPAMTFVATLEAVLQAGGKPVLVDIAESDYCLDLEQLEAVVGPRTRFVLPVHLFGQMADMRLLARIAETRGLRVLEDACQAHGARRDGVVAGTAGFAGAFSFYPSKNLGAFGDAGALVTDDERLAATVRALREHGQREKYRHDLEGYTARLDTIQALVLLRKLPLLTEWNDQRGAAANRLLAGLDGVGDLRLPPVAPGSAPVWHLFVVRTADPTALLDYLSAHGINAGRHYPEPLHLSAAYDRLGYEQGAFPVAEALAEECVSLPIFPGISDEQIDAVVDAVIGYFRNG